MSYMAKVALFTGFRSEMLKRKLEASGWKVVSGWSKAVTRVYMRAGESRDTAKYRKAVEHDVPVSFVNVPRTDGLAKIFRPTKKVVKKVKRVVKKVKKCPTCKRPL